MHFVVCTALQRPRDPKSPRHSEVSITLANATPKAAQGPAINAYFTVHRNNVQDIAKAKSNHEVSIASSDFTPLPPSVACSISLLFVTYWLG